MEHNQQGSSQNRGRRGHFHRGRRPDRRGQAVQQDARPSQNQDSQAARGEQVDVEQIMRDIRSRIAQRHGIDLSTSQIQELAARRLEAILDPRNVSPTLLEQLRKSAGARPERDLVAPPPEPAYSFEDTTLYDSHRGLLRAIRKLLNPLLKLFFNPNPLVHALNAQARLNAEQAVRESERDRQQAEWNALHFELLRRVVTESARLSLEVQALTLRVESLAARVDFADRRVRTIEANQPAPRHGGRQTHDQPASAVTSTPSQPVAGDTAAAPSTEGGADGQRRRRRRRRGRRNGPGFGDGTVAPGSSEAATAGEPMTDADESTDGDAEFEGDSDAAVAQEAPQSVPPAQAIETVTFSAPPEPSPTFAAPEPAAPPTPDAQPQADGTSQPTRDEPTS